ncbi:MAG: 3-oxoacyl-[acyl-carrier protein] reductase, partial [uncultured Cytophagales bacterium]
AKHTDGESSPGRRGHPGRRPRHCRGTGRRRRNRVRDRPVHQRPTLRVQPARNHRGNRRTRDRGRRQGHCRAHRSPRARAGAGTGGADRKRKWPARRAGQRHLGRRVPGRVAQTRVGTFAGERAPAAPAGGGYAPGHEPLCPAAAHPQPRRPAGGNDRRHGRLQRGALPAVGLLRPGQNVRHPPGLGAGPRTRTLRLHGPGPHAGLAAVGDHADALRRGRSQLARRPRKGAALCHFRDPPLRRPGRRRAGRRPGRGPLQRPFPLQRRTGRRVRLHRPGRFAARRLAVRGRSAGCGQARRRHGVPV